MSDKPRQPKRHKILNVSARFDFEIPQDMPKENASIYAEERLKKLCEKINKIKGVHMEYVQQ